MGTVADTRAASHASLEAAARAFRVEAAGAKGGAPAAAEAGADEEPG